MAFRAPRRRFVSLLTAMLFGLSIVGHGFAITAAVLKMSAAAAATTMEMPSPGHAMDCGDDVDKGAHAACVAACASAVAILCEPIQMPIFAAMQDMTADVELPFSGRGIPPEPYPPKPVVLI